MVLNALHFGKNGQGVRNMFSANNPRLEDGWMDTLMLGLLSYSEVE